VQLLCQSRKYFFYAILSWEIVFCHFGSFVDIAILASSVCHFCKKYHENGRKCLILLDLQLGSRNHPLGVCFCQYGSKQMCLSDIRRKSLPRKELRRKMRAAIAVSLYLTTTYAHSLLSVNEYLLVHCTIVQRNNPVLSATIFTHNAID
jgi:hypothetical protein